MKLKYIYFFTIIGTIITGLLARAAKQWLPGWINLWLGDLLYAFMMYFIVAMLCAANTPPKIKAIAALVICYLIEFTQLYQAEWVNTIRATLPGRLVLGSGFLSTDLVAYTAGIVAAFCVDMLCINPRKTTA